MQYAAGDDHRLYSVPEYKSKFLKQQRQHAIVVCELERCLNIHDRAQM